MPGVTVKVMLQDIKKLETEALVVGFYQDIRPLKGLAGELDWLLCGALSRLILEKKMTGALGEMALLTSQGKVPVQKIFMIGLGPRAEFSLTNLQRAAHDAAASVAGAGVGNAALECFQPPDLGADRCVAALRQGLTEGAGGRSLDIALLASDTASFETLSRSLPIAG
jgi:Cytosol aminopeptidase family, N-terminal domain